jgi:hypothetical protein
MAFLIGDEKIGLWFGREAARRVAMILIDTGPLVALLDKDD